MEASGPMPYRSRPRRERARTLLLFLAGACCFPFFGAVFVVFVAIRAMGASSDDTSDPELDSASSEESLARRWGGGCLFTPPFAARALLFAEGFVFWISGWSSESEDPITTVSMTPASPRLTLPRRQWIRRRNGSAHERDREGPTELRTTNFKNRKTQTGPCPSELLRPFLGRRYQDTPAAKESAAMSSCSRRRALGTLLLAALSLDASALHIPPSCGVEALRGGANPLKQCLGLRIRNPFHKLQPPPPPPPPPRKVTFKEKYFKVWTTQLFGPPGGRARTPLALSYSGAVKNLHPCDACGAGD